MKGLFLVISGLEHPTYKGLSRNSSFIPWTTVWGTSWSEVISPHTEICWDRYPAWKSLIHWCTYCLFWGRNSRNILTSDSYFLDTCVTLMATDLVLLDDCPLCWWFLLLQPWKFKEQETENLAPGPVYMY